MTHPLSHTSKALKGEARWPPKTQVASPPATRKGTKGRRSVSLSTSYLKLALMRAQEDGATAETSS